MIGIGIHGLDGHRARQKCKFLHPVLINTLAAGFRNMHTSINAGCRNLHTVPSPTHLCLALCPSSPMYTYPYACQAQYMSIPMPVQLCVANNPTQAHYSVSRKMAAALKWLKY